MKCPQCGYEQGMDEAVPKSVIRKMLSQAVEEADTTEDKCRALDLLSKLEGYTGPGMKKDPKKMGVFIVQSSSLLVKKKPDEPAPGPS